MNKKTQKTEICSDCLEQTNDFYKISTNRGDIVKCSNCYELWIIRATRKNLTQNPNKSEGG